MIDLCCLQSEGSVGELVITPRCREVCLCGVQGESRVCCSEVCHNAMFCERCVLRVQQLKHVLFDSMTSDMHRKS